MESTEGRGAREKRTKDEKSGEMDGWRGENEASRAGVRWVVKEREKWPAVAHCRDREGWVASVEF